MHQDWFVADPHWGHANIIKHCRRPFMSESEISLLKLYDKGEYNYKDIKISDETVKVHDEAILGAINSKVSAKDTLWILGDVIHSWNGPEIESVRKRIRCERINIILGNHDNAKHLKQYFNVNEIYDQKLIRINGQQIFLNHYPMRSWDQAHRGAWCLGGHTHASLVTEDNGDLLPSEEVMLRRKLCEFFNSENEGGLRQIEFVMETFKCVKGIDLYLDVGVDNIREGVPFGTPWNIQDLRGHFDKKMTRWLERKNIIDNLQSSWS